MSFHYTKWLFSINSHAGGEVKGAGTKENRGKNVKREEEEKKRKVEALSNCDHRLFPSSFLLLALCPNDSLFAINALTTLCLQLK